MRKIFCLLLGFGLFLTVSCGPSNAKTTPSDVSNESQSQDSEEIKPTEMVDKTLLTDKTREIEADKTVEEVTDIDQKIEVVKSDTPEASKASPVPARRLLKNEEGEVVYAAGDRLMYRDGDVVYDVDPGLGIESYDTIQTGDTGMVEAELRSALVPKSQITIHENTTFTFTLNIEEQNKATAIELAVGYIEVTANQLTSDKELEVKIGSASLGVRGTTFSVTSLPSGDFLVTCVEGKVQCSEDQGSLYAVPGQVVEKSGSSDFKAKKVPVSEVKAYRDNWYEEKVRLLREDALTQIKKNASEYEKRLEQFKQAYNSLMSEKTVLNKWVSEDKKDTQGSMVEVIKEKKVIIGHLQEIKQVLFWFETVYIRLLKIKKYHDQGYGKGQITPSLSTTEFFQNMVSQKLEEKLADVKYIFKLYAKRNDGSVPVGGLSDPFDFADEDIFNF